MRDEKPCRGAAGRARCEDRTGRAPARGLFLAVFFAVGLHGVIGMLPGVNLVAPRGMSVMCSLFVVSSFMMLGCFSVVMRGMCKVLCSLLVSFSSFLRHVIYSMAMLAFQSELP
jgi:hypothetical protein